MTKADQNARLDACASAESILHLYEEQFPGDTRPWHAIQTARRFALGEATETEIVAAAHRAEIAAERAFLSRCQAGDDLNTPSPLRRAEEAALAAFWATFGIATKAKEMAAEHAATALS